MADILSPDTAAILSDFLRQQTGQAFAYGVADCGLYLADWVIAAKGVPDPAAHVRGTYSTAEGAAAALGSPGFLAFVADCAAAAGCPPTEDLQDGDFAVLDMPWGLVGAVMTNGSWALRTPRGLAWSRATPGKVVQAWAVFHA